jgi:hypothetical protein
MGDLFKVLGGVIAAPVIILGAFFVMRYTFNVMGIDAGPVVSIMIALTPIWLPFVLFFLAFERWMDYTHVKFRVSQGRTTLRIKIPAEVFKSPEAMENVLAQLWMIKSPDNLMQTYLDGKRPLVMSLELVSIGGDVRLYINCATKQIKNVVEAQLYAQYPGVEVIEEEFDYTDEITFDEDKFDMFSLHIEQKGEDVYPIKTYIDMGMDKLPKEEFKLDPMAAMIELLGTVKSHERLWVQLLCIPHAKKNINNGHLHSHGTWEHEIEEKIDEIMGRSHGKTEPDEQGEPQVRLTTGERDLIESMERQKSKYAFEVGIRWFYTTKKGSFDGNIIAGIIRSFAAYDYIGRNKFGVAWRTDFGYKWFQDRSGKKLSRLKKEELHHYKLRQQMHGSGFNLNPSMKMQKMSVEELATMFHVPSSTVMTPGLARIPSTRKEAPSNLPTGIPSL